MSEVKRKAYVLEIGTKNLAVMRPTAEQNEDATMEYNRVFSKCLIAGCLLREKLEDFMRTQSLWDDEKEKEYGGLITKLNEAEMQINKGGIKLAEARNIAIGMRETRLALQRLIAKKNALDVNTAQGQAEQARFNYLLVKSLVYNDTNDQYYSSVTDYLEKQASGTDDVGYQAAEKFGNMYFGLDSEFESGLPENVFLKTWQFVNESLRLIDKQGRTIDKDGRLVDNNGRLIDDKGHFVDKHGNPLTITGEYDFKPQPFLDDEGNPIILITKKQGEALKTVEEEVEEEKSTIEQIREVVPKAKKKGRPAKTPASEQATITQTV
jgi:hypothetical protein